MSDLSSQGSRKKEDKTEAIFLLRLLSLAVKPTAWSKSIELSSTLLDSNTKRNETDFIKKRMIYESVKSLSSFKIAGFSHNRVIFSICLYVFDITMET